MQSINITNLIKMKQSLKGSIIKSIGIAALTLFTVNTAGAVSAYPGFVGFRQPNGVTINVRMQGDEFMHWAESEDGYAL